jgi:hypothetical protein
LARFLRGHTSDISQLAAPAATRDSSRPPIPHVAPRGRVSCDQVLCSASASATLAGLLFPVLLLAVPPRSPALIAAPSCRGSGCCGARHPDPDCCRGRRPDSARRDRPCRRRPDGRRPRKRHQRHRVPAAMTPTGPHFTKPPVTWHFSFCRIGRQVNRWRPFSQAFQPAAVLRRTSSPFSRLLGLRSEDIDLLPVCSMTPQRAGLSMSVLPD